MNQPEASVEYQKKKKKITQAKSKKGGQPKLVATSPVQQPRADKKEEGDKGKARERTKYPKGQKVLNPSRWRKQGPHLNEAPQSNQW